MLDILSSFFSFWLLFLKAPSCNYQDDSEPEQKKVVVTVKTNKLSFENHR
jgi:hypothetical protein